MAKKQKQMSQVIHWSLFIASALTLTLKTLEVSAHESYRLIEQYPEIASYSGLVNGMF